MATTPERDSAVSTTSEPTDGVLGRPAVWYDVHSEFSGDVMDVLGQLFEAGARALDGDTGPVRPDTARQILTSAETVTTNKLPGGEFRDRLLFGCERALSTLDADPVVAAEHCRAMAREVDARR